MIEIVNLYSKSTGDFSDYGDLNDGVFMNAIYNTAHVISLKYMWQSNREIEQ